MATIVGINRHYPSPDPLMVGLGVASLAVPALLAALNLIEFRRWPWVGLIFVLFAVGGLVEIAKWINAAIERSGYETAIGDLRLLCIGEASFRGGYPDDPRNLLAAAIVTLEAHPN